MRKFKEWWDWHYPTVIAVAFWVALFVIFALGHELGLDRVFGNRVASTIIGTVTEFAFFAFCGWLFVYLILIWYERKRLPSAQEYGEEEEKRIAKTPEWQRLNRFSMKVGIIIGIIAVLLRGPMTMGQVRHHLHKYTTSEDAEPPGWP
jgi:hypothetical protein